MAHSPVFQQNLFPRQLRAVRIFLIKAPEMEVCQSYFKTKSVQTKQTDGKMATIQLEATCISLNRKTSNCKSFPNLVPSGWDLPEFLQHTLRKSHCSRCKENVCMKARRVLLSFILADDQDISLFLQVVENWLLEKEIRMFKMN